MDIIEKVRTEIIKRNQEFIEKYENYNFWERHIKYVVFEALKLADKMKADKEIVELGALLHDVALMSKVGTKADHHINGAKIAEDILLSFNYPKERMQKVVNCVLHHRSCRNAKNIEEMCVCDADILAHYDNIPMCFEVAIKHNLIKDTNNKQEWINFFSKDYNDLSEQSKIAFKDRFNQIMDILFPSI